MDRPTCSRSAVLLSCTFLVLTNSLPAQLGGPNSPSQYPPGYPNDYPYPSNRYPQRIPGGPTVGIPIPEIKLPKRGGKKEESKKETENRPEPTTATRAANPDPLRAVTGRMRSISDRELLLEVEQAGIFRFRLLTKTRFQDAKGEPMRDSLLKPGDVIAAHFHSIDEETIVVVQLVTAGTPQQRAAAAKPVDLSAVKVPEGLASQPVQTTESASARDTPSTPDPDRPVLQRRADSADVSETVMPKSDKVIEFAREQAAGINASLPNFLVRQNTTRWYSFTQPPVWQAQDVVTADVAYVNGAEEYRNISVNGRATKEVQKSGSWSTGEFATTLQDILSPVTGAAFTFRSTQTTGGREAMVYDLIVPRSRSHWRVIGTDGKAYVPSYRGTIWIDRETSHVLRVEQFSISFPSDCPFDSASWIVEYDAVRIENGKYMLPVKAETGSCVRSGGCSRNEVAFANYRKFSAESQIKYDFIAKRVE